MSKGRTHHLPKSLLLPPQNLELCSSYFPCLETLPTINWHMKWHQETLPQDDGQPAWTAITVLTCKPQLSPRVPPLAWSPPGALLPVAARLAHLPQWVGREGRARHLGAAAGPRELSLPCFLGHRLSWETHSHLSLAHLPSLPVHPQLSFWRCSQASPLLLWAKPMSGRSSLNSSSPESRFRNRRLPRPYPHKLTGHREPPHHGLTCSSPSSHGLWPPQEARSPGPGGYPWGPTRIPGRKGEKMS